MAYEVRISDWSSDVCSSDLKFRSLVLGQVGLYGKQVIGFKRVHCINGKRDPVALDCYTQPRTGKVERRRFSCLNLRKRQCRQDRDPQEAGQRRQIETQRHYLMLLWDLMDNNARTFMTVPSSGRRSAQPCWS